MWRYTLFESNDAIASAVLRLTEYLSTDLEEKYPNTASKYRYMHI